MKTIRVHSRSVFLQAIRLAACVAVSALGSGKMQAQLTWGIGGAGGAGTWNTTTANWWNGSGNVAWNGGTAIFAGTGGPLTSVFPGPVATALVFNAPGYSINSGWIVGSSTGLTITTNAAATIGSTLNDNFSTPTLTKNGAGMLTVTGTNFFQNVRVDAGEYRVGGSSSLFFSDVTLADAPGVMLTLARTFNFADVGSLSGGGIVQPDTQNRTVTMTLWDGGSFGGTLRDNGSGKLALTLFAPSSVAELTGTNTYTGATTLIAGTLSLAGNGSALNTASVCVGASGVLRLDNSTAAVANRLADAVGISVDGGKLELLGNASAATDEQLGVLSFSGAAKLSAAQSLATPAKLTFAGAARTGRGTVDVTGSGRTTWGGLALTSGALIAPYVTAGNEWATLGGDGGISPLAVYVTDLNTASAGDDVKIIGGGSTPLVASAVRNSLNLQNSSGGIGTVVISVGQVLTLASGGLLTSGSSANEFQGGSITSAGSELVVTARNALTVSSTISETTGGMGLTKNGADTLSLSAVNSYSGNTAIVEGTLAVSSDGNLGTGAALEINGGTLKATGGFSSAKELRQSTSLAGVIDTNGNNLSFAGGVTGSFSKTGAGTLTLTNGATGNFSLRQGTLALPNAVSGSVTLAGGNLVAAGTLGSVTLSSTSTLEIGGAGAATLASGLSVGGGAQLTIAFDVGSGMSDHWNVTGFFPSLSISPVFLFDFRDLGGVTTVADYVLFAKSSIGPAPQVSAFALTPSAIGAGWNGTFSVTPTAVSIRFTTVPAPEPSSALLLLLGGALAVGARRRRCGGVRARASCARTTRAARR